MIAVESRLLLQGNDIRALTAVAAQGAYPAHMRDRETIDSELRICRAFHPMADIARADRRVVSRRQE
jgi:hypothetical protein